MSDYPDGVFKLDSFSPLYLQVLKLAGWYPGRSVDISEEVEGYSKFGYILTDFVKNILSEFYKLEDLWRFRWELPDGRIRIGGYEYTFLTTDVYNKKYTNNKKLLPVDVQATAIPIIEAGWHQFDTPVWVGENDLIYHVIGWNGQVECFTSVIELLESDIQLQLKAFSSSATENLFVTFGDYKLLHWDK